MVDSCNLVLYDNHSHQGNFDTFSGDTDLRAGGHHHLDRNYSAKLSGSCKNTSYLVFPHPWDHKGENGGLAFLVGESDNPRDMDRPGVTTNPIGSRYYKHGGNADNIVRINIPTQNINEGRMRYDLKVMGKSNSGGAGDTHLHLYRENDGNPNASDQWLTGIYNNQGSIKKGKPCPGGDAYWKKAMDSEISCVYDVKTGSGLGRIRELHGEIKNTFSGDPRKAMFDKIAADYCDRADRLNDKITSSSGSDSTCRAFSDAKELAKVYCESGDNIETKSSLCTNESDSLGPTLYNELSENYCKNNPDKEFCKCYNVVNYETVCANRPTSVGCAKAKEVYDKYVGFNIPDPNVYLPCGDACKGVNNYQPPGYKDGCDGTINACVMSIEIGESNDEVNAACNIDSTSGLSSGGSGGSGGSDGSDGSGGSGGSDGSDGSDGSGGSTSVPLSTTQTSDLEKTVAEMKKQKEEEDEEAKKTNKKLLIGGGGGVILSSISCLMFLVIVVVLLSKKGGGGRRR